MCLHLIYTLQILKKKIETSTSGFKEFPRFHLGGGFHSLFSHTKLPITTMYPFFRVAVQK
jgi:hypothetical protein